MAIEIVECRAVIVVRSKSGQYKHSVAIPFELGFQSALTANGAVNACLETVMAAARQGGDFLRDTSEDDT